MDERAKITSKGRITVPLAIRRALGVRAGDELVFEEDKAGVRVRPVRAKSHLPNISRDRQPGNRLREESDHSLGASDAPTMMVSLDTTRD